MNGVLPNQLLEADIKRAIVKQVELDWPNIQSQWDPPLDNDDKAIAMDIGNWDWRAWEQEDGSYIGGFDCEPFDGQMRAYVTTDNSSGSERITKIEVVGE